MALHDDQPGTNKATSELLTNTTIVELLRVAFKAGYAAAQHNSFHVADAHLQAVLEQFKNALHLADDSGDSASSGVRAGGDW